MQPVRTSMMDPAVRHRSGRAPATTAASVSVGPSRPLPLPAAAAGHRATRLHLLAGVVAGRQAHHAALATRAWPLLAADPETQREALALADAAWRQWTDWQAAWWTGLHELAAEAGQLREANTLSKYVDQESNLAQLGVALVAAQTTAAVRLAENIQHSVSWWLTRTLQDRGPAAR